MKSQFSENFDYRVLGRLKLPNFSLQKTAYVQGAQRLTHAHKNPRFVFVLSGAFSEIYERKKRECFPFTTIFRPSFEKHSEDYHGKRIVCLRIDLQPAWLKRLCQYNIKLDGSADFYGKKLIPLIKKLNNEFDNSDDVSALAIESIMLETVVVTARPERKSFLKHKSPRWLSNAKDFIHAEFSSSLTVSEIAAAVDVHPVHLARVFRYFYGCTIAEYIRRLRVEFACQALTSSNESLAEIAVNAGFSDQSHFSKTFKRLMNLTPTEYRAAILSR